MFDEYEVDLYEKEQERIQEIIKDYKLTPIKLEDLKVGQTALKAYSTSINATKTQIIFKKLKRNMLVTVPL